MVFDTIRTAYKKDPALKGVKGYIETLFYPGVVAIINYKIARFFRWLHIPIIPRALSYWGRFLTGIEIHPGATIGKHFFIDHGTGVVIGETAVIGDDCMLYHGVTLGGHGWWHDTKGSKRHPTLENDVVVGVGSSVLGPVTIGKGSRIGAMVLVIDDIPPNSVVVGAKGKVVVKTGKTKQLKDPKHLDMAEAEYFI